MKKKYNKKPKPILIKEAWQCDGCKRIYELHNQAWECCYEDKLEANFISRK